MEGTLEKIKEFHGHIGPYAVLGYKMGKIANEKIGKDPFSKTAVVYTDTKPPLSCLIDGIQLSSRCTLGKANIEIIKSDELKAEFTNKQQEKILIKLKPKIRQEIDSKVNKDNMIEYSKKYFEMNNSDLFEINLL